MAILNFQILHMGILIGRDLLRPHVCWSIGNGQQAKIWDDPWVPTLPDFRVDGTAHGMGLVNRVSQLICYDSQSWNKELINQCFTPREVLAILSIRLPVDLVEDKLL
ncbi:hypothetical protein BVC80_1837g170 [Macleaya cordata]|uniref:Uncharacterized protein n=1 Tax=Macleaya cordata TaxID=56857 RepID=A0A200R3U8_MACCD|nr:hypothetical protein BVC80_1837g170 [Macleaya cordata]